MNEQKIKIILINGFTYSGIRQTAEKGFISILDNHDNKNKTFPNSSISMIERID